MPSQPAYQRIKAMAPVLDEEGVGEVLRQSFGLGAASCRRLPGETDANFHVATAGGEYLLKICHEGERPRAEFQTRLLRHVAEADPALPVPRAVATGDGATEPAVGSATEPLFARLLSWLPGSPIAGLPARPRSILEQLGATAARLDLALAGAASECSLPEQHWDLTASAQVIEDGLPLIEDAALRDAAEQACRRFRALEPELAGLPQAPVHQDLNGFNLLTVEGLVGRRISGIIDFGDARVTARVAEPAVLLSSLVRSGPRPLAEAATVIGAYHRVSPLTEAEVDLLADLVVARLAVVAVTVSRLERDAAGADPRHRRSGVGAALVAALATPPEVARGFLRRACGLPAQPASVAVAGWLNSHADELREIVPGPLTPLDLSARSSVFDDADPRRPPGLTAAARYRLSALGSTTLGRHGEPLFLAPQRRGEDDGEAANVRVGVDIFAPRGTAIAAPLAGTVELAAPAERRLVVRHEPDGGPAFWVLYNGVEISVEAGQAVAAGAVVARVGADPLDDRLPPHFRLQLVCAATTWADVPLFCTEPERQVWLDLFPDPALLLPGSEGATAWRPRVETALAKRRAHLAESHPLYFEQPIDMVRARGSWFYDEHGRAYLDALNNVTLLGHCDPRLAAATARQAARLNTNARFVYDGLGEYAEELTATLPEGLDVVYFVNSGSEAVDLALRMSRHLSGREDVAIIDDAYHGYTSVVSDISPSRYRHTGKPETTHPVPVPDRYRGEFGYDDPAAGRKYAEQAAEVLDGLARAGRRPAALIFESLLASAGQIVLPPDYLESLVAAARGHGAYVIADEVQVGFGRLGEAFWGFEAHGVVPDFVAMGKAMGNGFPVAALVTSREISRAFDASGRFFSTYGGNPVACAVGLELLRVMAREDLQQNALVVGQYLDRLLRELGERHEIIGDVRGQGFYRGVELVRDRDSKEPAREETMRICEGLKDRGVLVYPTSPRENVLKLKPPLVFGRAEADLFVAALDQVLTLGE